MHQLHLSINFPGAGRVQGGIKGCVYCVVVPSYCHILVIICIIYKLFFANIMI